MVLLSSRSSDDDPALDDGTGAAEDAPASWPAERLWQAALAQLRLQVSAPYYETYLRETAGTRFDGSSLVVSAPSDFVTEWLSGRLRTSVMPALRQIVGGPVEVSYEVLG